MTSFSRAARRAVSMTTAGALIIAGLALGAGAATAAESPAPDGSLTSTDKGDGTYTVPLLNSDVPDVSVTLVPAAENDEGRDIYYMISTTMHLSPGAPIMKSYDLVNWETVNYVYNRLSIGDALSLRNGKESYGQGQWASSIRYHNGRFYVLFNTNNVNGAYLFSTDDIDNGSWEKTALGRGFHDPSLFFDTDGTPYIFYGSGSTSAVRLSADLKTVVQEYPNIFSASDYASNSYIGGLFEGAQVYKIGSYYYIFIVTWPSGQNRQQVVFRSPYLLGKYAPAANNTNTYESHLALNSNGFAQGGLVEVTRGTAPSDYYGMFFRDTYPAGRIPALIPSTWSNGWPVFGNNGDVPYGGTFTKPITLTAAQENLERQKSVVASDDFANDAPRKGYMDEQWEIPAAPSIDTSLLGTELFQNPGFESGTTGWDANGSATLTATTSTHGGTGAISVTTRTTTGAGPIQTLTGKLQHGVTYDVSGWVRYDNAASPASKQFLITAAYGNGVFTNLASVTATKGEWSKISGSFTIPDTQPLDSVRLFVETPWTPSPQDDPNLHLMDFLVDDMSLQGRPVAETPNAQEIAPSTSSLDTAWQWNHNPDNRYWSLTSREGWLRLTAGKVVTGTSTYAKLSGQDELAWFEESRNTLSQRSVTPRESVETKFDVTAMKDGDVAGLAAYTRSFAYAAVKKVGGQYTLGIAYRGLPLQASIDQAAVEQFVSGSTVPLGSNRQVYLKADLDYQSNPGQLWVTYRYSFDGQNWSQLGQRVGPLETDWSLAHFMGYRVGLFNYATQTAGGSVDFDYFYLSDTLSSQTTTVSQAGLDAALAEAQTLVQADYPAAAWASFQSAYTKAQAAKAAGTFTQNQADAPAGELSRRIAELAVIKEAQAPALAASATAVWRCVAAKAVLAVSVTNDDDVSIAADVTTPFGTKTIATVATGKTTTQTFSTRQKSVGSGTVSVALTATKAGLPVTRTIEVAYPGKTC